MDGTMYFVCSDQAQLQHPVSLAGQDLHQYQADQWLHSPVLESTHRNQHTQSLSLSSSSFQPAEIHPQQHHHHYQPAAGFNGPFTSSPLFNAQPVVQQTPPQSSAVCFPLDREQFIDQQFQQMHQLLQRQYQSNVEAINQIFQSFWLYWNTRQTYHQQQSFPTVALSQDCSPYQASPQNTVGTTAVNEQQHSMDQLFVPPPTTTATTSNCDNRHQQRQQQQKEGSKISLAVPTSDGIEIKFEYVLQSPHAAEVLNAFNVKPRRQAEIIFIQHPPTEAIESVVGLHQIDAKFVQHLLDRNGHRMDSTSGRASVLSDVFQWMITQGGIRIKPSVSSNSPRQLDHRPCYKHHPPSSLFPCSKTVVMVLHRQRFSGGDVENH